jgi:hypothetical protein
MGKTSKPAKVSAAAKARARQEQPIETMLASLIARSNRSLAPDDADRYKRSVAIIKELTDRRGASLQNPTPGGIGLMIEHPFNMTDAANLKLYNEHHSTCVKIKRRSLVGLGLKDRKFRRTLNPLCRLGTAGNFYGLMDLVAADFVETGNGYIEVVREGPNGKILGLHHCPSRDVKIIVEDQQVLLYELHGGLLPGRRPPEGQEHVQIMCAFGQSDDALALPGSRFVRLLDGRVSEMIHFKAHSNISRYYGVPDWLPVVAAVELIAATRQHVFDFFNNRGVPALLMFLQGGFVGPKLFKAISTEMQNNVGGGNAWKSSLFHLPDELTKVTLQQLSPQNTENGTFFKDMQETLATVVVSAHSVPPALAGIQIPGKLGSVNDLPNSLVSFQTLEVGPVQNQIEEVLWETLGNPELNGGLAVPSVADDSDGPFEFNEMVNEMAKFMQLINPAKTMASAKENLPEQAAGNRDLNAGVKT